MWEASAVLGTMQVGCEELFWNFQPGMLHPAWSAGSAEHYTAVSVTGQCFLHPLGACVLTASGAASLETSGLWSGFGKLPRSWTGALPCV